MITLLVSLATKVFWWLLPRLTGYAADYCDEVLDLVFAYEGTDTANISSAERRRNVLQTLAVDYPVVPEFINRAAVEIAVLVVRCGVSRETVNQAEVMVSTIDITTLSSKEKRDEVFNRLKQNFNELPDRVIRLLIELSVAKQKGAKA